MEEKRHDEQFMERIRHKILHLEDNTKDSTERKVKNLFLADFIMPGEFAKKLPLEFTEQTLVWRTQFTLSHIPKHITAMMSSDAGKFAVVGIIPENPKFITEYYT